jgi:hypothetical protein
MMVVQAIIMKKQVGSNTFNSIISHIQSLINDFISVGIYHVKKDLNSLANQMAKLGTSLEGEQTIINGIGGFMSIT